MNCFQLAPLALLFIAPLPEGALRYQPESGVSVQTHFESSLKINVTELTRGVSIDGEEHPVPEQPAPDFTMTETETIEFTDVIQMQDGVPKSILRSFSEVGNHMVQAMVDPAGEEHGESLEGESELEGARVLFTWDSDAEEFSASFGEDSGDLDADLLEGLIARCDFAGFLPDEDVSEGDEWEVPTSAYIAITNLCGDLNITREDDEEDGGEEYNEAFDENLAGDLKATWKETREEDGVRYAVIALAFELTTEIEREEEVTFNDVSGTQETTDSFEFELAGELLWNLAGNRVHSLNLTGDLELQREMTQSFDMGGRGLVITEGTTFEGTLNYSVTID